MKPLCNMDPDFDVGPINRSVCYWQAAAGSMVAGTVLQAAGQQTQGQIQALAANEEAVGAEGQAQAANYSALMEQRQADQEMAAASKKAGVDVLNMKDLISTENAGEAARGVATTSPTVVNQVTGPIRAQGTYNALSDLWSGANQAQNLRLQATLDQYTGAQYMQKAASINQTGPIIKSGADLSSMATLMSGASSLYSKYGSQFKQAYG